MDYQYAKLFLGMAAGVSMFLAPLLYLMTKFPKDMAEVYTDIVDSIEREKDTSKIKVATEMQPFYSESNMQHLKRGVQAMKEGKGVEHDLIEEDE